MTNPTNNQTDEVIFVYLFTVHYLTGDGNGFMHLELPYRRQIDCLEDIKEVQDDCRKSGYRGAFVVSYNLLRAERAGGIG